MLFPLLLLLMILFFPVTIFLLHPLMLFLEIKICFLLIKKFHNVKLLCIVVNLEWQNIVNAKYLTLILWWKLWKQKKRKSPKSNHWRSTRFLQKATLNYFQKLIKDARRGFQCKVENAQLMYSIYGNKLDEVDYQMWLVNALKLKDRNELIMFLSYSAEDSSVITSSGHNLLSINERELVFNFWKIISEISINISKKNILIRVSDIQDSNISTVEIKRDYKLQLRE